MKWTKQGLIFIPGNNYDWMVSHAQVPIVYRVNDDVLRIYFATRDKHNRSVTTYIEVLADNPQNILYINNKIVLGLGELGCFDDSGVAPSWIVAYNGNIYLYYIGWNVSTTVSYRLSIGVATSNDEGQTFNRLYQGPIMDRIITEPQFCTAPCIMIENNIWKMWYVSCIKWGIINNHAEPFYVIRYAESSDGIYWKRSGQICIGGDDTASAFGRPCVFRESNKYKMIYSHRGLVNYRNDSKQSYRLGYAESIDGINWVRKDNEIGIERSPSGWDSEMICYGFIYKHNGKTFMVYNGNGFGKSGFGYAVLDE